jgi:hypothetical protein
MEGKETNHVMSIRYKGGEGEKQRERERATRNYWSPVDLKHFQGVSE